MTYQTLKKKSGYSLFELLAVIIIVGIIATVSMRTMRNTVDVSRVEETRQEMNHLAWAIAGNPNLVSGGVRTDFGYVGDIGALPATLDALVNDPGWTNWDGPYIRDDFYASSGGAESEFKYDGWGVEYTFTGDSIISTGGGANISRVVAHSSADLLSNTVEILVTDIDNSPPGSGSSDVDVELTYPDGTGTSTTSAQHPPGNGFVTFSSIPVGHHELLVIYSVTGDTLFRKVVVYPGESFYTEISFADDYW